MLVEGSIRRARTDWPSGGIARRNAHPHYFTYDSPPSNEEETRRFRRCRDVYQPVIADDLEGRRCVFLAGLYRTEREIAERLKALAIGTPPWSAIDADKGIPWVEQRTRLALALRASPVLSPSIFAPPTSFRSSKPGRKPPGDRLAAPRAARLWRRGRRSGPLPPRAASTQETAARPSCRPARRYGRAATRRAQAAAPRQGIVSVSNCHRRRRPWSSLARSVWTSRSTSFRCM